MERVGHMASFNVPVDVGDDPPVPLISGQFRGRPEAVDEFIEPDTANEYFERVRSKRTVP